MPTRRERARSADSDQLELARAVQQSLLPKPLEPTAQFELAAHCAPAQVVGGDFYDYFQPQPELVSFYLGDVQGKGLEGAMYAALVSGIMRGLQKSGNPPALVMNFLNRRLRLRPIPNKFCTLGYAVLDLRRRRLTYANAGLPFPLLCRRGRTHRIEQSGLPLGLFDEAGYDEQEVELEPGDLVLVFTDGLVDSLENRRVRDGEVIVRGVLESSGAASALEVADRLLARLPLPSARNRRRPLLDDATFLLLRIF